VTSSLPVSLLDSTRAEGLRCNRRAVPAESSVDDVLARAQTGDHDAFSKLYSQHRKRVFAVCMRMVHEFSLAEDLTQETFLQLYRKLTSFRGNSLFTTWLHRMTVNIVLMRLRKGMLPVVSLDRVVTTNIPEEHGMRSFGACDRTQAGVVDRVTIERAVATLAPGRRKIFLLHDVYGFQHDEIASLLGCGLGTSKAQLHYARRALRDALSGYTSSRGCRMIDSTTPVSGIA
jgi:RNA polymerase sigma-70 factor (ECF subfamily)